ncbi:MAG TPA: c-type cytochrome [Vicinamibacterales bacterium]|nr:c-type cytochrome [Vicinamibacterales bacterium]
MSGRSVIAVVVALVAAIVLFFGGAVYWLVRARGFSARATPTPVERVITSALHRWSVPASARNAPNPVPFTPETWAESRAHFADHCATCHGNDGRGDTEMGRGMFPRAPDMRLPATQRKTDGELYWIIENGVRLTGMPAWGAGGGDDVDTWKLVHFIRHLNDLTPDQLKAMAAANPKTPGELEEEQEDERFLAGEDVTPPPAVPPHHH